jgi:hypothetical protein
MRLTEFIDESKVRPYDFEDMDAQRCWEVLNKYCTQSREMMTKPIWRGMNNHDGKPFLLVNPGSGLRRSANTTNQYTEIMSSSPYYEGWPKRNASFICSANVKYAQGYGSPYAIFPVDGAKIAVCPYKDLWDTKVSILEFNKEFLTSGCNMDNFNRWLSDLELFDAGDFANAHNEERIIRLCNKNGVAPKNFLPILQQALSPKRTGIKLVDVPTFVENYAGLDREVWVGDPVVAINQSMWFNMVKGLPQ